MGLPKAVNAGELSSDNPPPVPESVTYTATLEGDMMTLVIECGTGVFWTFKLMSQAQPSALTGSWVLAPEAAALKVGPAAGNGDWWSNSEDDVTTRSCLFDDHYVFNADGSFQNVQGDETWLEPWQGSDPEACGAPVAPHDGSNAATWDYDAASGTVTLNGPVSYTHLTLPTKA